MPFDHKQLQRWSITAAVALISAAVAQLAGPVLMANLSAAGARQDVKDWAAQRSTWTLAQWEAARTGLMQAGQYTPHDASLQESLATLYSIRGLTEWGDGLEGSPGIALFKQALTHQQVAAELRPRYPYTWANLAYFHYAANSTGEEIFEPWDKALALGPNEVGMRTGLLNVARLAWTVAPDHVKGWAEQTSPGATARFDKEVADAEAAYAASQNKAHMEAEAVSAAMAAAQAREAAEERAQRNANGPAFKSVLETPAPVQLPR